MKLTNVMNQIAAVKETAAYSYIRLHVGSSSIMRLPPFCVLTIRSITRFPCTERRC